MARRLLETAGFITIAAALHVSAAAMLIPTEAAKGPLQDAAPAPLAAGSPAIEKMVSEWEAPPDVEAELAPVKADQPPEPQIEPARSDPPQSSQVAAATPQPMMPVPPAEARPNLPEQPPEPVRRIDKDALPEFQSFDPPEIEVAPALTLDASARPAARPVTKSPPQPQKQAEPEPRRQQSQPEPRRQAAPAQPGQGGQAQTSQAPANDGGGGASPQQIARAEASWRQQVGSCMARSVSRVSGGRGARLAVNFVLAPNGRVIGASLAGSSGNGRVDQQVLRAVQRARCPAAPATMRQSQVQFTQPFMIR